MDAKPDRGCTSEAGHEIVDHTSEIVLRVWAPDFPTLVQEATRAFGDLVPESIARAPRPGRRVFGATGRDRAAALVEWLNEAAYLCEAELWLPRDIEAEEPPDGGLSVWARGEALSEPFVLVKAATLHGARVEPKNGGLVAEVTLDI